MTSLKLSAVSTGVTRFKSFAKKYDVDGDGQLSNLELERVGKYVIDHAKKSPSQKPGVAEAYLARTMRTVTAWSKRTRSSVNLKDVFASADELKARVRKLDRDQDGVLSDVERARGNVTEKDVMSFSEFMQGRKVSDFTFPSKSDLPAEKPAYFDYRGTPSEVCTSLLNAFSKKGNDNFWPYWANHQTSASRYVLDKSEATAMVGALKKLYAGRQQAVLTELSRRTQKREFGCVSPDADAQKVFAAYAKELGLASLPFNGPKTAPAIGPL